MTTAKPGRVTIPRDPQNEIAQPCVCGNCDWTGDIEKTGGLEGINRLRDRIDPGDTVPAGECPECGSLAYLDNLATRIRHHAEALYNTAKSLCDRAPKEAPPITYAFNEDTEGAGNWGMAQKAFDEAERFRPILALIDPPPPAPALSPVEVLKAALDAWPLTDADGEDLEIPGAPMVDWFVQEFVPQARAAIKSDQSIKSGQAALVEAARHGQALAGVEASEGEADQANKGH